MNRGRNKENIFHNKKDFEIFLNLISKAHKKFSFSLHAFCLMNNHYHLLIEDIDGNLSKIMHYINRNYVEIYNKTKGYDGSLFKSRFKSIIVDHDEYLLELTRYIHRNPIKLVKELKDYKWSSYPYYLGLKRKIPSYLNKDKSLGMLGFNKDVSEYELFVNSITIKDLYKNRKNLPSVLGSKEFKNSIYVQK